MANQLLKEIPKNLEKIGKKKRKFLLKKLKDCDPSKIEEILSGSNTDVGKMFKNKQNKKHRKGKKKSLVSTPASIVTTIPKSGEEASSNWANILSKNLNKAGDEGPKEKPIFYRRSKTGAIVTNDPNMKKTVTSKVVTETLKEKEDVWFDDVDPVLLDVSTRGLVEGDKVEDALVKSKSFTGLTKVLGLDCEMVGVGRDGTDSILARVSIVNHFGHCVYDKFVAPREKVTDYRTEVSGVRPQDLVSAPQFPEVQAEVAEILKGRLVVGHALSHDFKALFLDHPKRMIRDTSKYKPFKAAFGGRTPSLKNLTARFLGVSVQTGEHSSVQDSQAAVRLYTMHRKEWEAALEAKRSASNRNSSKKAKKKQDKTEEKFVTLGVPAPEGGTQRAMYCPSDSE